jgi:hypothetical protein
MDPKLPLPRSTRAFVFSQPAFSDLLDRSGPAASTSLSVLAVCFDDCRVQMPACQRLGDVVR